MIEATSRLDAWRDDLKALFALLLLVALHVTALELREPNYFLRDDNAAYYLPVYVHTASSLFESGEPALLNHHQYLGLPHLAMGQTGVLYPPIYAAAGFGIVFGIDLRSMLFLLALGHLMLSAAGVFLLLRSWSVPRWTAVGGAMLWATFPFLAVVSRSWIVVAYAAAWLPWCLFFLDAWLTRGMRRALVGYAVGKAIFFFAGYAQFVILSVLFEGIYVALRTLWERRTRSIGWWRRLVYVVGALCASGGLAAPLLFPMWQAKEQSEARAGELSLEEFLSNSLDLAIFARSQIFDVADRAVHQSTGAIFYLGLPVLFVLGLALVWAVRNRRQHSQMAVLVGVSGCAMLLSTEAVRVLYSVPLLGSFRWPFKSFVWVLLFAALATTVVVGRLATQGRSLTVAAILAVGLAGNVCAIHVDDWDRPFGPNQVQRPIADLQNLVAENLSSPQPGRAVAMWMSHGQEDIERFLTHNYATLAGVHSLGGYEPLVSRLNFDLAKGLEYSNIWRYELTTQSLDYLSEWSVRWLLMPDKPRNRALVGSFPELRIHSEHSTDGLLVVENTAAAPFAFLEPAGGGPPVPLRVDFGSRGLSVDLESAGGRGGLLRIQVAPLEGYGWSVDGEDRGPIGVDGSGHVVLEVEAGAMRVDVEYAATAFRLGGALALVTALLGMWWLRKKVCEP